jgi:sulfatase maturation enzyme AslB (radical SAM superfamily)
MKYTAETLKFDFPKRVELELVSDCNLRCTYCPRHHLNELTGYMDFELFQKLIDEISSYPDRIIVLHRRGESLLHPDFVKMCAYIKGKFAEVQIATNGTMLDIERSKALIDSVDFVSFSLDSPANYDKTRFPAKYKKVEEKIHRFLDMNQGRIKTQVSMVQTDETPLAEVEVFKSLWQGKVDRIRVYQEHSKNGQFGSLGDKRMNRVPCVMPFYELLVFCDGKVGRCNHDWNGQPMGDANELTLKEMWDSSIYEDLRNQHLNLLISDSVCSGCDSWYPEIGIQGTGETIDK